jgi:hypothetical protein
MHPRQTFERLSHSGMVEATGLKVRRRGYFQWLDLPTEFHEICQLFQKLLVGTHTQPGDLKTLTFLFNPLKNTLV